jgi:hypothetical protein
MSKRPKREGEGRPTKYKKEYCKMLVEHMSKGFSFESFAGLIEVHRDTLYEWCRVHKEFSDSKMIAAGKNQLFWETAGIEGMWQDSNKKFNSTAWIFNMKNRFGWSDKKEDEDTQKIHTVKIELPGQRAQQVISMEPKKIEAGDDVE